jgi:thiosulfate reductase/polysulfide reductase chain A
MAKVQLQISRRTFLKSAVAGGAGVKLAASQLQPVAAAPEAETAPPWYYRGQIKTTYSVCDMCPWRCGIIAQSVDGRVYKIDGNPARPQEPRDALCARAGWRLLHV